MSLLAGSKEHLPGDQFRENTTDRPHIDSKCIILVLEKHLRRPIPQGDNTSSVHSVLRFGIQCPSEPKISDLDLSFFWNEDIGTFDITMCNVHLLVQVLKTLQKLLHHIFDLWKLKLDFFIDQPRHIIWHVVKQKVEITPLLILGRRYTKMLATIQDLRLEFKT